MHKKPKLLFVSGTYCPAHGGAEVSMHTFLRNSLDTLDVLVATDLSKSQDIKKSGHYEGVSVIGVNHDSRVEQLTAVMADVKPDVVITQLMWSDVALTVAKAQQIPTIYRLCKLPCEIDLSNDSSYAPAKIMGISSATRDFAFKKWGRESSIISPPIDFDVVLGDEKNHFNANYITMFNPVKKKGGFVFEEIARQMPQHNFAYVPGWDILRTGNEFDKTLIERLCVSLDGSYHGRVPTEPTFAEMKNVTSLIPTRNVGKIYDQTKLLLIPSQWEEAFGRVAIEGMANGIPVIGSAVGGLQEQLRHGGVIVDDYSNPSSWINAVEHALVPQNYRELEKKGPAYVQSNYSLNRIISQFQSLVLETIRK